MNEPTDPSIIALLDAIESQWTEAQYELIDALFADTRTWPDDDDGPGR